MRIPQDVHTYTWNDGIFRPCASHL